MNESVGTVQRDGQTFTLSMQRDYQASIEEVWQALVEPDRLQRWLGTVCIEPRAGGRFEIDFDDEDHAGGGYCQVEAMSSDRPTKNRGRCQLSLNLTMPCWLVRSVCHAGST